MSARDRNHWDVNYRDMLTRLENYPAPDPLMFMYAPPLPHEPGEPSSALDLACGLGQNGLWLAAQGYSVDLVDISRVALVAAQEEAGHRGLRNVNYLQLDLEGPDKNKLIPFSYEVVCVFRYFRHDLIAPLRAAIKPGGRIICETWNVNYLDVDPSMERDCLVEIGELSGVFADWQLLRNSDNGITSQLVAIKPGEGF